MFKNDERYWDINLLNKWFAISSVVFLVVMVWVFIDDNDDESGSSHHFFLDSNINNSYGSMSAYIQTTNNDTYMRKNKINKSYDRFMEYSSFTVFF